jgi:hypothetical protein
MTESKAPTEHCTRPLGNTGLPPTPLATDISPHVRAKLKDHPDQQRRMREHLRLKQTHSGHARD